VLAVYSAPQVPSRGNGRFGAQRAASSWPIARSRALAAVAADGSMKARAMNRLRRSSHSSAKRACAAACLARSRSW
jgi:hypothetical protein